MKHLKQLVRNIIDPTRDLGHVDRHHKKEEKDQTTAFSKKPPEEMQVDGGTRLPNEDSETAVPTDSDAAIATGPPEIRGKGKSEDKVCEDCA